MKIGISNSKGGIGKSICSIFTAEHFSRNGNKTLLVDAGYQATTSNHYEKFINDRSKNNLLTALQDKKKLKKCVHKINDNFDILPAAIDLTNFAEHFNIDGKDLIFQASLSSLFKKYEYVVFDTESSLGSLTRNALICSDVIILPVYDRGSVTEGRKTIDNIKAMKESAFGDFMSLERIYALPVMKRFLSSSYRKILTDAKIILNDVDFLGPVRYHKEIYEGNLQKALSGKAYNDYSESLRGIA